MKTTTCINCGQEISSPRGRMYCDNQCGAAYRWKLSEKDTDKPRECLECGKIFYAKPWQNQKRLCSNDCRRSRNSRKVKEWQKKNPEEIEKYRETQRAKKRKDSSIERFYRWNPDAPRACEACGETRVLDSAHKPGHERVGRGRCKSRNKWPEKVWVLCPTCHALLDRLHYSPEDLGLTV